MPFLYLFLFLFNTVTSSYSIEFQNKILVIYNRYSIYSEQLVFFNFISYFDCPNDQCELCIWDSSLIYDVHFYNSKVVSYSLNKTLSVNSDSLSNAYSKFISKNYPIHGIYVSVVSLFLCIWFIVFRYNKILFPIGAIILSVNSMLYYISPRGWYFFLFDPFCRLFLLSITIKQFFPLIEKRRMSLLLKAISQYLYEIQSRLYYLSLWIALDLFVSLIGHLYLIFEENSLYFDYLLDDGFNKVYSIKRKYIYSIIYHSTLSLLFLLSIIWVIKDMFDPNFSDVRRNVYFLYIFMIYMLIIAVFYFPMFKLEITLDDIQKGWEKMVLFKMKREYLVEEVSQTKFRLTDKEANAIEIANKENIQNIIVVSNPMNNISTGTIKF